MAGRWLDTRLGDVLTLQRGFDLPAGDRRPGTFPVVASTGVVGTHREPMVEGPGVVIGRSGSLGGAQYVTGDFWPLNTTLWVKDFKGNDRRFCYYLLKSLNLQTFNVGSGVPTLNRNHVHPLPVRIPVDVNEQRTIAHILGTLDDRIELNRRMNETLEAMARALFKSWFIEFDPVHAKAEGRDPGFSADIAALFPDSFEDSDQGKIPKGWEVKTIGDLVDVVGGGTPSTKEPEYWSGRSHLWATPKDLSGLSVPVLVDTARRITDAGLSQISSGLLPIGTVLLSSRAPIGYLAIAESPTAINQGFIAMLPKKTVSNVFVLLWAKVAHDDIVSRANGSTFLEINKANFRPIPVVGPTLDIMAAFDRQARTLYDRIVVNVRESSTLATLRDTLLPKLLSGELRVKDVDRSMEAHA